MTSSETDSVPIVTEGTPCTNNAMRRATRQLGILYDEAFAPTGLKGTQLLLMWRIAELGTEDDPTLLALADRLAVGLSALTHALRPLVRDGLVELRTDAQDRRSKRASLTALGRTRIAEGARLWSEANQRLETLLGPASARMLRAIADQVASEEFAAAFRNGLAARPRSRPTAVTPGG